LVAFVCSKVSLTGVLWNRLGDGDGEEDDDDEDAVPPIGDAPAPTAAAPSSGSAAPAPTAPDPEEGEDVSGIPEYCHLDSFSAILYFLIMVLVVISSSGCYFLCLFAP
jgi:hypothetical protein